MSTKPSAPSAENNRVPDLDISCRERDFLTFEFDKIERELEELSFFELTKALADTRDLHLRIFSNIPLERAPTYAGRYRSDPSLRYDLRDPKECNGFGSPVDTIDVEMENLSAKLEKLNAKANAEYFFRSAIEIFHEFIWIHPFLNGNGRISRLILRTLMGRHADIVEVVSFSVFPRPFEGGFVVCDNHYKTHPELLERYFQNWFQVEILRTESLNEPPSPLS